jgi:hypothetical protein
MKNKAEIVRSIYLYLVSLTGILMTVFSIINLSNNLLDYFFREQQYYDYNYLINSSVRGLAFLIIGLLFFIYHWRLITHEKRIGKREEFVEVETKMNLFESIFFYALSYAGLMIFSIAFASFLAGFAYVSYIEKPISTNPSSQISVNLKSIIQGLIAMVVGAALWLLGWRHIQKAYAQSTKEEKSS